MAKATFLGLPVELRGIILDHATPVRRLCKHKLFDEEFRIEPPEGRALPPLFWVCKAIHEEAAPLFYAKAILEVAPPRPYVFAFSTLSGVDGPDLGIDLSQHLDTRFGSLPARSLKAISRIHIFSNHQDAISAESYESTLRWLIQNTRVQEIQLSRRLLCRLRRSRIAMLAPSLLSSLQPERLKTIQVFSDWPRSEWERIKRRQAEGILGQALPWYHLSCSLKQEGKTLLQSDPRWDIRKSDSHDYRQKVNETGNFLDRLLQEVPLQHEGPIRYSTESENAATAQLGPMCLQLSSYEPKALESKLYQVIFVDQS